MRDISGYDGRPLSIGGKGSRPGPRAFGWVLYVATAVVMLVDDDGVLEFSHVSESLNDATDVAIHASDLGCVDFHASFLPVLERLVVPSRYIRVTWGQFEGVINNLERRYLETDSDWKREEISQYQSDTKCERCNGYRLKDEALCVKIDGLNISEVTEKSILDATNWFENLKNKLDKRQVKIAEHILKEINERLDFLLNVGLDYLTLSRESGTLSGGESQRIRLASQIGSGLTGVLYVLDEPSIGLHQKDNVKLINALKRLRDLGNTVIVVEHDIETMESSDHIIDIGPEAGLKGGQIVAEGEVKEIIKNDNSITGNYLSGKKFIPVPKKRRSAKNGRFIEISGASGNNLKKVNLKIPVGTFTCVTGVSGSGKSTLILHTLYNAFNLMLNKNKSRKVPKAFTGFKGTELILSLIHI